MNNETHEKMEDLATSVLVEAYIDAKGRELLKLNEQLQADPEFDYSEEAKQRILAAIDAEFDKQRRQNKLRQFRKYAARAAMFAGLFLVIGVTTVFSVDALRIRVMNTIIEYQERYATMTPAEDVSDELSDLPLHRAPTWMPEGFVFSKQTNVTPKHTYTYYEHPDGRWVECYWAGSTGGMITVDTEDPLICKEIKIHDSDAVLVLKEEWRLYWIDYTLNSFFVLTADSAISEADLIAIAESIK